MLSLVGLSAHPAFHWWSANCAARMLLSDKLTSCCAAGTNGCAIWGAVRLHSMDGWVLSGADVQAPWHGLRDSVAPLRRSSAGWMPARIGRLSAGVGHRHPVTIRKASLVAGWMRRVWALWHHIGAQYSAVECTRARVAIRRIVAPAPEPEPASRLRSATRDVSFLRSYSFSDFAQRNPSLLVMPLECIPITAFDHETFKQQFFRIVSRHQLSSTINAWFPLISVRKDLWHFCLLFTVKNLTNPPKGSSSAVAPKFVWAVIQNKVEIMSYFPQYFVS